MLFVKRRHKPAFFIAITLVAIGLIGYGVWGFWQRHEATHTPNPVISTEVVTYSTDTPDETPPGDNCADYTVADEQPRAIELPSLGVSGCIQRVGVDQNNAIAVPTNIHVAGWFVESPLPGDKGVSILAGHVLGRYNDAIFANLSELQPGDRIRVQFGDMSWREFEAVSSDNYSVEQASVEQYRKLDGSEHQLTLITCGGRFDAEAVTYDERVLVRARLLE